MNQDRVGMGDESPSMWRSSYWLGLAGASVVSLVLALWAYLTKDDHPFWSAVLLAIFGALVAGLIVIFVVEQLLRVQVEEENVEARNHILNAVRRRLEQAVLEISQQMPEALGSALERISREMEVLTRDGSRPDADRLRTVVEILCQWVTGMTYAPDSDQVHEIQRLADWYSGRLAFEYTTHLRNVSTRQGKVIEALYKLNRVADHLRSHEINKWPLEDRRSDIAAFLKALDAAYDLTCQALSA
jgi:hypothetical protein